ncbi:MAG: hypothetical protein KBT19_06445 [Lachnospiraceae bacterium]|nr:hypothetical protein [Candidatus Colinaster equi]
MDKYEYKLRSDEIKSLIKKREFEEAVEIADTIDWTRVRSATTLCTISDLYKINKRYNEAKILLEQAYTRCQNSKAIVYSLCELCIKMEEVVQAMEYYKMFVQMAPTDNGKFILLYKIYEAQDASLEERIECLEELKKRERTEKWCYELARLYQKVGLISNCVDECDELVIWFREGKYIKKAMELKMLYQPLTEDQERLYRGMLEPKERQEYIERTAVHEAVEENVPDKIDANDDIYVKPMDVGQYSTINIQKALAESIKGTFSDYETVVPPIQNNANEAYLNEDSNVYSENTDTIASGNYVMEQEAEPQEEQVSEEEAYVPGSVTETIMAPMMQDTAEMTELFFKENAPKSTVMEEISEIEEVESADDITMILPNIPATDKTIVYTPHTPVDNVTVIKPVDTSKISSEPLIEELIPEEPIIPAKEEVVKETPQPVKEEPMIDMSKASKEELMELIDRKVAEALDKALQSRDIATIHSQTESEKIDSTTPPRSMQKMLSQEYDGQISLVVPEEEKVEKQITGQIDIEEFLSDWENSKKKNQERHHEEIKRRVLEQTGSLFTDFEATARDGILEKLEQESDSKPEPIDADKEYKEYLKTVMNESVPSEENVEEEYPEVEEIAEVEDVNEEPEEAIEDVTSTDTDMEDSSDYDNEEELVEESEQTEEIPAEPMVDESESDSEETVESDENTESSQEVTARNMTDEEIALFGSFVQTRKARTKLLESLDNISLAAYTGNVFVTGESMEDSMELAKNVMQYARGIDDNFSGKVGKVSGSSLNEKAVDVMLEKLANGGLIIEKAGDMRPETVESLLKALNQEKFGVFVVMQDTLKVMNRFMNGFEQMKQLFNIHVEVEELSDDALVAYGRKYADHMEYSIDEMGILALHTRIDELQTSDHIVTVTDVREIVDEAIEHATKFSFKHVTDVMFGKRYDEDDMIILKERDFIN